MSEVQVDTTQADLVADRLDGIATIIKEAGLSSATYDQFADYLGGYFNKAFALAKEAEDCPPQLKMILERIL
jgi:hypothetical protein